MNKGMVVGGLVAVVVVIGLVLLVNRSNAPATVDESDLTGQDDLTGEEYLLGTPLTTPVAVSPSPLSSQSAVKEFSVAASEFTFTPSEIRVKQGDMVRVVLTNTGAMPHDWKVDEFNAGTKVVAPGQSDTVEFIADQAGTFEYYCSVGQHRANGMVGKLIVE